MNYDYLQDSADVQWYADKLPTFDKVYSETIVAMKSVNMPKEEAKAVMLNVLRDALRAYAQTNPTTKGGGVLRKIAVILSYLNPLRWLNTK